MYLDTKALTANLGSQIKLKLESNASKQNKNGPNGPFVVYEYEVLNNNQVKIMSSYYQWKKAIEIIPENSGK
jgi:hypothetical protein